MRLTGEELCAESMPEGDRVRLVLTVAGWLPLTLSMPVVTWVLGEKTAVSSMSCVTSKEYSEAVEMMVFSFFQPRNTALPFLMAFTVKRSPAAQTVLPSARGVPSAFSRTTLPRNVSLGDTVTMRSVFIADTLTMKS